MISNKFLATARLELITPCPITKMIHIRMVVLPIELCRLMYLHIWYAYLVLFTWFFYKCKPFKVINPVIICRGDWIRHLVALEEGGGGTENWLSSANELTAESQSWGEWAAQCTVLQESPKNLDNSDVKRRLCTKTGPLNRISYYLTRGSKKWSMRSLSFIHN